MPRITNLKLTLQRWTDFSETEIKGFVVIVIILCMVITAPYIYGKLTLDEQEQAYAIQKQKLDSLSNVIDHIEYREERFESTTKTVEKKLAPFNPNTATKEILTKVGFKEYIADRIIKFRSKNGSFKIKKDLAKIYGISPEFYHDIEAYIALPDTFETKKSIYGKSSTEKNGVKKVLYFDLNTADSTQLEQLYGIGFKTANRIIKYREKLGGFIDMTQLSEVWGLDTAVLTMLYKKTFIADNFTPTKINLNTTDLETLKNQPYIGYKFGRVILAFRDQRGGLSHIDQLKEIKILTEIDILRMKPYLEFK